MLAALGINTFFTGRGADDIAVNPALQADADLIAAAAAFVSGDGGNAGRIAALDTAPSGRLGEVSLVKFYNGLASEVASASAAAREDAEAAEVVFTTLQAQRESLSGVNLDEEAIQLVKFQRAFQGAARFVGVVDGLLNELVTLIR